MVCCKSGYFILSGLITRRDVGRLTMRFLEYGLDFDQNFQLCLKPMMHEFGVTNDKNEITEFEDSAKKIWDSFKNWFVKNDMSKKSIFKRLFQIIADHVKQTINVVTLFKKNTIEDPLVYKISASARNYIPTKAAREPDVQLDPIYIVHLFDEVLERNGLMTSFSSSFKGNL